MYSTIRMKASPEKYLIELIYHCAGSELGQQALIFSLPTDHPQQKEAEITSEWLLPQPLGGGSRRFQVNVIRGGMYVSGIWFQIHSRTLRI